MPTEPATSSIELQPHVRLGDGRLAETGLNLLTVAFASALTYCIYGYRFAEGNHTIYLLDALHRADPNLLANDWFTTQTLQYHAVFGILTQKLIEWRAIETAFFILYLMLILLFHLAGLGIARSLGTGRAGYLLALALLYFSAAGTGLGMYQFFQDSSFVPSNVANVAMLWAIYLWLRGHVGASGGCLGVAGLFHLNHAVVGVVGWMTLCAWQALSPSPGTAGEGRGESSPSIKRTHFILGSVLALGPAMVNIVLAARVKLQRSGAMPLNEFIDLYVRLRHPHHYDPASWPAWLWLAFLWPVPVALVVLWRRRDVAGSRAGRMLLFLLGLQVVALLGAGVWFVSESLVQMSLYRFSIFAQLLACTVITVFLFQRMHVTAVAAIATTACAGLLLTCLVRGPFFGAFVMPTDDADYLAICDWARDNTPVDAIFLVPPGESSMRLRGQRAIVVNYKAVPQLSGELPHWRDRLEAVLAINDLLVLPRGYRRVLRAIDHRYASLDVEHLISTAERYQARFIVAMRPLEAGGRLAPLYASPGGQCFVYDRIPMEDARE